MQRLPSSYSVVVGRMGGERDYEKLLPLIESLSPNIILINRTYKTWPYHYDYFYFGDLDRMTPDEATSPNRLCQDNFGYYLNSNNRIKGTSALQCFHFLFLICPPPIKVIFCGVPLTDGYGHYLAAWITQYELIKQYARSMSGKTKDLLGQPTKEWLHDN